MVDSIRTIGRSSRRLAVLAISALLILGITGMGASAAAPKHRMTKEEFAQKLLDNQDGRLLSGSAKLGLRAIAGGERAENGPERDGLQGAARQATKQALGAAPAIPTAGLTNVRVNDPATDTHQVDQTTQSETTIAVAGSNVAVGYNDSQTTLPTLTAASTLTGYSYSTNGGATFTDGGSLQNRPEFINLGDPWLGADRAGAMYFGNLSLDFVNQNLDIAVAKSTNGGKTWGLPTPVYRPPSNIFYSGDKDALTVGRDPAARTRDNVYVAWDDFSFDSDACFNDNVCLQKNGLAVARSTDGGVTWQLAYADQFIQDFNDPNLGCSFAQYIGAYPIVNPSNGDLFVAAEHIAVDDPGCVGTSPTFDISVFRSTDGGQTFGPRVKIADVTPSFPTGVLVLGPAQFVRNLEFPTLAFKGNNVFAAWNDGAGGNSHVRLAKSTNNGRTWSLSWVTSGSNDEFQPALSGDSSGLHLLYYRRNNNNTLDTVVGDSSNGNSFDARRVTTTAFQGVSTLPQFDPIIAFTYMGDYIANVSVGNHRYFAWGDNRDKVKDFLWPNGRNDPNVYFARQ
jgi:hypothetical protein